MSAASQALSIASGYARGGSPKSGPTIMPGDLAPAKISIKGLSDAFDKAIAHHMSLPEEQRIANSKAADDRVAQYVGRYASGPQRGMAQNLLSRNTKLLKAEGSVKGYDALKLPNGQGVETSGLSLAPAYQAAGFNTCPNSASCKGECLGKTSGGYWTYGGASDLNAMKGPRLKGLQRLMAMVHDPEAFAVKLSDEVQSKKREAERNGNHFAVRPNVISDIHPRVYKSLFEAHPDVSFFDYTKNATKPIAPNHHLTYSSTGLSQPEGINGNEHGVKNPHQNWHNMRKRLDEGQNVAMAFTIKQNKDKTAPLPEHLHDTESGKTYRVIDGDTHDFRPFDAQPKGSPGVVIGLRNKNAGSKQDQAHVTSNGFMVHWRPENGSTVKVAPQDKSPRNFDNDSKVVT